MKKLVLVLLVLFLLTPIVKADEVNAYFKWNGLEFNIPIKDNIKIVSLCDLLRGEGLIGGKSQILKYHTLRFNFGAVTSFKGRGTPFISIDRILNNPAKFNIGLWFGRDFHLNVYRGGIETSIKIW